EDGIRDRNVTGVQTCALPISETLGDERKWVHYGLTSTDVVDTALSYLLKQANDILLKDLGGFVDILKEKAREHKYTVMMGRTHEIGRASCRERVNAMVKSEAT